MDFVRELFLFEDFRKRSSNHGVRSTSVLKMSANVAKNSRNVLGLKIPKNPSGSCRATGPWRSITMTDIVTPLAPPRIFTIPERIDSVDYTHRANNGQFAERPRSYISRSNRSKRVDPLIIIPRIDNSIARRGLYDPILRATLRFVDTLLYPPFHECPSRTSHDYASYGGCVVVSFRPIHVPLNRAAVARSVSRAVTDRKDFLRFRRLFLLTHPWSWFNGWLKKKKKRERERGKKRRHTESFSGVARWVTTTSRDLCALLFESKRISLISLSARGERRSFSSAMRAKGKWRDVNVNEASLS